jgi:hypothetical protein
VARLEMADIDSATRGWTPCCRYRRRRSFMEAFGRERPEMTARSEQHAIDHVFGSCRCEALPWAFAGPWVFARRGPGLGDRGLHPHHVFRRMAKWTRRIKPHLCPAALLIDITAAFLDYETTSELINPKNERHRFSLTRTRRGRPPLIVKTDEMCAIYLDGGAT